MENILENVHIPSPLSVTFKCPDLVREFKVDVPNDKLNNIKARLLETKLPRQMPPSPGSKERWETGANIEWLEDLRMHWLNRYDWRKAEARINNYSQFIATVDDFDIHFFYVRGEGENPLPLVLTHGSPGSVLEFLDTIELLTEPSKHGGKASESFTVIIPSLPGFGFSSLPKDPIHGITTARLWHKLIKDIIGHDHYVAQGGNLGAAVAIQLAELYPDEVRAIHLNFPLWFAIPKEEQTEAETRWIKDYEAYFASSDFDYLRIQINKPLMAGVALNDSPMGTATWIAEKFWSWCDHGGKLENVISKDDLITNIMFYLIADNGMSESFWYFRGYKTEMNWELHPGFIKVPTAIAIYPKEHLMAHVPLNTAKRGYNVIHYREMPRGGHFAAMEQPELFAGDIREALAPYH